MKNEKIILGIDPGLATTGFGAICGRKILDFGVIETAKEQTLPERLCQLASDFSQIMAQIKPQLVVVEKLIFVKNVTNGLQVAHARGVILQAIAAAQVECREILPKDVKLHVCGFGNASKLQVQTMVKNIFSMAQIPRPDDAADALAIAFSASGT